MRTQRSQRQRTSDSSETADVCTGVTLLCASSGAIVDGGWIAPSISDDSGANQDQRQAKHWLLAARWPVTREDAAQSWDNTPEFHYQKSLRHTRGVLGMTLVNPAHKRPLAKKVKGPLGEAEGPRS
jgi:hypothetical protein